MLCLTCRTNPALIHPSFGVLECQECQEANTRVIPKEFIPDRIREDRREGHRKGHTIQPFRKGQLSLEYVKKYGTSRIQVTPEEVKNAKNVWNDLDYYHD